MKVFVKILPNTLMKIKINLFYKHEYKNKTKFFSNNNITFQPGT